MILQKGVSHGEINKTNSERQIIVVCLFVYFGIKTDIT